MHSKRYYFYGFEYEKITRKYKFRFNGGYITVEAKSEEEAKILAQAEAIKKGWSYEILPNIMSMEELKELINQKVDEICDAYQERTGACKNVEPFDKVTLDAIEGALADFVVRVCK